jgi:hypothetical protein
MRRNIADFGIGADRAAGIRDAVTHLDFADALAHRLDHARAFNANPRRQRQRVKTGAVIGVDEIEADRMVAHCGFTRSRGRHNDRLPAQHLGAAGLVNANGVGHGGLLLSAG